MRLRRAVLAVLPAALAVPLLPGTASAAVRTSCSYDAGVVTFDVSGRHDDPPVTLDVDPAGAIRLAGVPCGAATVTTTDSVAGSARGTTVRVDVSRPFAPGATPEADGLPEIEITLVRWFASLWIAGGPGPDDIRRSLGGLHLNGDADSDLSVTIDGSASARIEAGDGDDVVDLSPQAGAPSSSLVYDVYAGAGDDLVRGTEISDGVFGGDGADRVAGGHGGDYVLLGAGDDVLLETATAQVPGGGAAVPDAGAATSTVTVTSGERALDVEVRATVVHPDPSSLTLTLSRGAASVVLGSPGSVATLFDDEAAAVPGRARPAAGTLAALLGEDARGDWTLSVTDPAADGVAATLAGWSLHLAGTALPGTAGTYGWDILSGQDGVDTISYLARTPEGAGMTLVGSDQSVEGGLHSGEVDRVQDFDVWIGTPGDDTFTMPGDRVTKVVAGGGDDTITLGSYDTAECGTGDDSVDFSTAYHGGTIDLAGGPGVVTLDACEGVTGTPYDDVVLGTAGADRLSGSAGNDTLRGLGGDDVVRGGDGNDVLDESDPGNGADVLLGDFGRDRVTYLGRGAGVAVTLDGAANDGEAGEGDRVAAEAVAGTAYADVLTGDGAANDLLGHGGTDALSGADGDDWLYGGDGDDVLTGGTGADRAFGEGGSDTFAEGALANGGDDLSGGAGFDTVDYGLRVAAVTVTVDAPAGDGEEGEGDVVRFDVENVTGGAGNDTITGSWGPNALLGGPGTDRLTGGPGADLLDGGAGIDLLYARDLTPDTVRGGDGIDATQTDAADVTTGVEVPLP